MQRFNHAIRIPSHFCVAEQREFPQLVVLQVGDDGVCADIKDAENASCAAFLGDQRKALLDGAVG